MSSDEFAILAPYLEPVPLKAKQTLVAPNKKITHNYFIERGLASIIAISNGTRLEIGLVGSDGVTGISVVMGSDRSPHETVMQVAGDGIRIASSELRRAVQKSSTLHELLLNFAHAFMIQIAHTALSNGTAKIEERIARWLLMAHDRIDGDEIPITHEFLSQTLGIRRAGVTVGLNLLQQKGAIRLSRGIIDIVDRHALESAVGTYKALEGRATRISKRTSA